MSELLESWNETAIFLLFIYTDFPRRELADFWGARSCLGRSPRTALCVQHLFRTIRGRGVVGGGGNDSQQQVARGAGAHPQLRLTIYFIPPTCLLTYLLNLFANPSLGWTATCGLSHPERSFSLISFQVMGPDRRQLKPGAANVITVHFD
jgi:hypothetical protein